MPRGVHFAIDAEAADRLLTAADDDQVAALIEEIEEEVAGAAAEVDQATLRAGYDRIDVEDYGPEFGDEDFAYTWSNYSDLVTFFQRAAEAGQHVIFTVDQ